MKPGGRPRRSRALARAAAAALLLAAAGCASLPTIVPDMARSVRATPQLVGAKGPLSAERSRQILARLQADQPGANLLARHLALEQAISDSPLSAGNKVELLEDGPRTYAAMLDAIASARDHIDMETYILEDDEAGRRFADALIERQRAGVQVNLIYDSVGTLNTPAAYFDRLREAGVALVEFNPVNPLLAKTGWDVNQRDHRKLLVVDGRTAILGGINISSVYSGGSSRIGIGSRRAAAPRDKGRADGADDNDGRPWRDTDLLVRGPVVAELQKLFFQTWEKQKGPPVAPRRYYPALARQGDEVVHAIAGAPDEPYSLIYATLISAIDNAEREVLLTNAYFVPDPQLLASLKAAAARGVDVRLVLPVHSDAALVFHAGRSYYEELLSAGVKIYERRTALLHAKTALIDGVWSTVGSTNLDWRSFLHNQELNVVVLGPGFATQLRASFDADLAQSDAIELSRWRHRSPVLRLKEGFARIWQYWL
jgi:cardiolipin synthase